MAGPFLLIALAGSASLKKCQSGSDRTEENHRRRKSIRRKPQSLRQRVEESPRRPFHLCWQSNANSAGCYGRGNGVGRGRGVGVGRPIGDGVAEGVGVGVGVTVGVTVGVGVGVGVGPAGAARPENCGIPVLNRSVLVPVIGSIE